jgi:prepilin-type N-terminal cleavage/methylation domain-containing protein
MFYKKHTGFTLIELLVTVSIIAILVAVSIGSFGPAREKSRDSQRQTDLRTVEAALALYKNKYGVYPAGCNPPTTSNTPSWSGQTGSGYDCPTGNRYIIGLAPEFLPQLPVDPRLNADETYSGFVYTTNSDKSVYKFMALNTVEAEEVTERHLFFRCGQEFTSTQTENDATTGASYNDSEICERVPINLGSNYNPNGGSFETPTQCTDVDQYGASYAISDGFSDDVRGLTGANANKGREYDTENVRCR